MSRIQDGEATRILKAEMARRGLNYDGLVGVLAKAGVSETNKSLRSKFSRGSFTADFFLTCLAAMEVASIRIVES